MIVISKGGSVELHDPDRTNGRQLFMNSNIRSVHNNHIHNSESTDLNQTILNQQIQIKEYRIMVSDKWGIQTLQLVICSFQLVWGRYVSQDLHLGILTRFDASFWGVCGWFHGHFARNFAIFYKVHLTLCLFRCGLYDIGAFLVYVMKLGLSFYAFPQLKGEIGGKTGWKQRIQPNPSHATPHLQ